MKHPVSTGADDKGPARHDSRIRLEREGRGTIDEIVASAREVPWGLNVLQLLWTAGPVVFLAMQGSHYLGFGTAAPTRNVVFFAAYTFLLGVIGLLARFAAGQVRDRRQRLARRHLTRALDVLPDLMFAVRDIGLAKMAPEARRREAARVLLHKADLGPGGVALAVHELTDDAVLADVAERIDMFRRLGMHSRLQDLIEEVAERRSAVLEQLHAVAPEAAEVLRSRLDGHAPSQSDGVPRGEGFLERILTAADRDEPGLMSLADVEDLLVLTLELISGREILRLTFHYEGNWRLARALDEVEAAQNQYRMVQGTAVSQLQSLATLLADSAATGLRDEDLTLAAPALLERVAMAMEVLTVMQRRRPLDGKRATLMRRALGLARRLQRSMEQARAQRLRYQRALERWQVLRQQAVNIPDRGRGLRFSERIIRLTDQQKLRVAAELCQYLDELDIRSGERGMIRGSGRPLGTLDARRLAMRLVLILEPALGFGDASIQRAIEASNAAYFHGLEAGFSAAAKAGLAAAVAQEVRQDLGRIAERLALRLSRVYQVALTPAMVDFLATQYDANRERLEIIAAGPKPEDGEGGPAFSPPAPVLHLEARRWRRLVQNAERALEGPARPRGANRGGSRDRA